MEQFETPAYKVPSASLTDHGLLKHVRKTGKPVILSTGMSTMEQIHKAVSVVGADNLVIMHCTSTYPCEPEELNLRMVQTLRERVSDEPHRLLRPRSWARAVGDRRRPGRLHGGAPPHP